MSGQWEVVTNNKHKSNSQISKKLSKSEKKKFAENAPKIEDIFRRKGILFDIEHESIAFKDAPLLWLKGLVDYLNVKLAHANPTLNTKLNEFPYLGLRGDIKEVLKRAFSDAGETATQHFYEYCLTSLANDMSKGASSTIGYEIILQMLALQKPSITINNFIKYANLLNSYKNQAPIGIAILWCLGQGGIKDISKGVEVWKRLMVPLIDKKKYTSFVVGYIKELLSLKGNSKSSISPDQVFTVLTTIYSNSSNIPKNDLKDISLNLQKITIESDNEKKLSSYFQLLLPKLNKNCSKEVRNVIENYLIKCLERDHNVYSTWLQLYAKNLESSILLLKSIDNDWKNISNKLGLKNLRNAITYFQKENDKLIKSKEESEPLKESQKICKKFHLPTTDCNTQFRSFNVTIIRA